MLTYFPGKLQRIDDELCSTVTQPQGSDLFCYDGDYDDNDDGDYDYDSGNDYGNDHDELC